MATPVEIKRLENVTDCAVCSGDLTDARVLPCAHSFCLKCVDKLSQNKKSGEKVACPLCRNEFEIPEGGTAALRKNYFVEKLLAVKKLSSSWSQGETVCDVCRDDEEKLEKKETKMATVYCVECGRNMCDQCRGYHQKFRFPGVHKLIELKSEMNMDELLRKFPENVCNEHEERCLELYCSVCEVAICMKCNFLSHSSHKCSDIEAVAKEKGEEMSVNTEKLTAKVTECETVLKDIEEIENKFCISVAETEKLICERADKLKQLIEDHKQSLLEQLSVSKDKQLKQTANVREEIERHQFIVENFIRYCNEVKEKGTACNIAKQAGELNARSKELQQFYIDADLPVDYDVTEVEFSSPQTDVDMKSLFGKLAVDVQGYFKMSGKVVHIIPSTGSGVTGVAVLNDQLQVGRWGRPEIAIYCPTTFQHQQTHNFTNTGHGQELLNVAACNTNNCLYAADCHSNWVFKINGQNYSSSNWHVGAVPHGLSVTSSHNVLVAVTDSNLLREYSSTGQLIREINLQPAGIKAPVHAIQLSDEFYAVTNHSPKHQFSIVNSDGKVVRSYSGDLSSPYGIVDDKKGRVLVADMSNNRVLVINPKTLSAYPLRLKDCQLNTPYSLHYDAANKRLYIGERGGCRIICCEVGRPGLL